MAQTKTNNSYLHCKIRLRANHLPNGAIKVLDLYGGEGKVWQGVEKLTQRQITRLAVDTQDYGNFHLHGDNLKFIKSLDLSQFNVIDVDAYGVPYAQLNYIFKSGYRGIIFVTFIQTMFGRIPNQLLTDLGFSKEIIKKSPALVSANGFDKFKEWLALRGVTKLVSISPVSTKHYLFFQP